MRLLITGGAGFVGSNLAVGLAAGQPDFDVVALDNLKRRGSELNLPRLRAAGVTFVHGDVRDESDLRDIGDIDAVVECSAEPSALAGRGGDAPYLVNTNLVGAFNCLELARRQGAQFVFLSTSRVYPYSLLEEAPWRETDTRYELEERSDLVGLSSAGVAEGFSLEGPRTLYGATKLAAEMLVIEYAAAFGLRTIVDRFGVIAGPWQMGKVDQGVFTYWMLAHYFGRDLAYLGYGGSGKQVRDLVHIDDVLELVRDQLVRPDHWNGATVNVGGGREVSLSLRETTELCREITGNTVSVEPSSQTRPGDVRIYLSDCSRLARWSDWTPQRDARTVLQDICDWIAANETMVESTL